MSRGLGGVASILTSNTAIEDEDRGDLYTARGNWNYQRRDPSRTVRLPTPWHDLWPMAKMVSGDPTVSLTLTGVDVSDGRIGAGFEEWGCGESGQMGLSFIRGQCIDANGNALGAATVQAFRTSDNLLAGTTIADSGGNYQVGTPYPGVAHYCVAYYVAGSLAGTTVNTLIPTS